MLYCHYSKILYVGVLLGLPERVETRHATLFYFTSTFLHPVFRMDPSQIRQHLEEEEDDDDEIKKKNIKKLDNIIRQLVMLRVEYFSNCFHLQLTKQREKHDPLVRNYKSTHIKKNQLSFCSLYY